MEHEKITLLSSKSLCCNYPGTIVCFQYPDIGIDLVCSSEFEDCPEGFIIDPLCISPRFCIRSQGVFKKTQRMLYVIY